MQTGDIDSVARMFYAVFRPQSQASITQFSRYFARLFFTGAVGDGGLVSQTSDGTIASAIAFVPMTYRVNGRILTARLACAFMAQPNQPKAAARIVMSLRARGQEMLFTDSASPISAGHWHAVGGAILPVNSLDWQWSLKPVLAGARRLNVPAFLDGAIGAVDRLVARRSSETAGGAALPREIDADGYATIAPGMVSHFAVHPEWSRDELLWLLAMAAENQSLGPLRFFAVTGSNDRIIGCLAAYFGPRGMVRVLDILALPGQESGVVQAMLGLLRAEGVVQARGGAHPHLLAALSPNRGMRFRHRAFTCIATRHQDIRDAIQRQDIYVGGLAGESWSRLMTDFH